MATILGTPVFDLQSGGNYTPETSAKDRVVIAAVTKETTSLGWTSGVATLGGNAMSLIGAVEGSGVVGQNTSNTYITFFQLAEANIPVGASAFSIPAADGETATLYTVELEPGESVQSFFSDFDVEANSLAVSFNAEVDSVIIGQSMSIYTGRSYTWGLLTKRFESLSGGGYSDWSYSGADLKVIVGGVQNITADTGGADVDASFSMAGVVIGSASGGSTVTLNEASAKPGDVISFSTDIATPTSVTLTDSLDNSITLTNLTDLTGSNWSCTIPDLVHGQTFINFEAGVTCTVTDGTDTGTDTIDIVLPTGLVSTTATAQASGLVESDVGYVGANGLDAPLTVGDKFYTLPNANYTHQSDGVSVITGSGSEQIIYWDVETATISIVNRTYTIDVTADAFSFVDLTGQSRSVQVESNVVTVTGISEVDVAITVTGGQWSKSSDSGTTWSTWSVDPGTVTLNDLVKVRHTTSSAYSTTTDTTLDINGVTDTFSTTTNSGDVTAPVLSSPSAFATGQTTASGSVSTNEANGTLYWLASQNATETVAAVKAGQSATVTTTGTQNVSVTGLTQGTAYYLHYVHTDAANNDSGRVSSAQFTTNSALVAPTMPVDVSVNVNEHTTLVGVFTASSGTAPITYSLSGTDAAKFTINGSTGEVNFAVAPNFEKDPTTYSITVTGTNSQGSDTQTITVNVQDVAEDHTPDAFAFADVNGAVTSTLIESNAVTVTGVKAGEPIPVSVTGGQYAVAADGINFGGWTSATTNVELGYVLKVRHTTSASKSTSVSTTLTIGGVVDTFTSTTEADLVAPVITLAGETTYTLLVGDDWAEPGYTAIDDTDGNITADVAIGGDTVNTAQAGTYVITYNVQDLEGNSADQAIRTIHVVAAGIQSLSGTVSGGASFDIDLFGVAALQAGQRWQGFIKVAGNFYPLSIDDVAANVLTVTAANDTPTATLGNAEIILQKVQDI